MDKKAALAAIGTATEATVSPIAIAATTGGAELTITTLTGGSTTIASLAIAPTALTLAIPGGVVALV